jgi:biopolymer transport protein ExbD
MAKHKTGGTMSVINVTPMVDVMLVLLIIFMVITPMLSKGVSVDMVRTRNPILMDDADKEDAVVVAVTRDGSVFLGRGEINPDELGRVVGDMIENKLDKTVYIKSDARARYAVVVEVVNILRTEGVDQLGLLTEKIQERQAAVVAVE